MEEDALLSPKFPQKPQFGQYSTKINKSDGSNSGLSASLPSGIECLSIYPGRIRSKSLSYVSPNLCNAAEADGIKNSYPRLKNQRFSRTQKIYLVLIYSATFMSYACLSVMAPFYPPEASKIGMSETTAGFVFSFYAFVMFITSPIFGILIPKFGARLIFILGHTLSGISNICFGGIHYIEDYTLFTTMSFIMRGAEGFGASAAVNAEFVLLSTLFPHDGGYVRGLFETFVGLGLGVGPAIGGLLYTLGGFGLSFYVIGALILVTALISIYVLPQNKMSRVQKPKKGSLLSLLKLSQVLVCCFTVLVISIMWAALSPTLEPHLRKFEFSPVILGLMFLLPSALYGICSPFMGYLTDRLKSYWWLMSTGLFMCSFSLFFMGPSSFITFILKDAIWLNIVSLIGVGVFTAMDLMPTYQGILDGALDNGFENNENTHSLVTSLWMSTYSLGDVLGPVIGGVVLEHWGFPAVSSVGVVLNLLMSLVSFAYFLSKRKKSQKEVSETDDIKEKEQLSNDNDEDVQISIIRGTARL